LGSYIGKPRDGAKQPLNAAFAHALTLSFRDGSVARLVQITDSALWAQALEPVGRERSQPGSNR
jgi:hypothetical protein